MSTLQEHHNNIASHWSRPQDLSLADQPDEHVRRWLLHPGSLTRLLKENLGDALGLELVGQSWQAPLPNEAELLHISDQQRCLIRHVKLTANGASRVLARVVIPEASMTPAIESLLEQQNEPLGPLLFSDPDIQRDSLEIALLRRDDSVFEELRQPAWCRRSVLSVRDSKLLIYEAFLPSLFETGESAHH